MLSLPACKKASQALSPPFFNRRENVCDDSAFGFAPCGPPWWRRTLTAPASMSRPPMTSIVWTRNCSALEIFAPARDLSELDGVALKSESTETNRLIQLRRFYASQHRKKFLGDCRNLSLSISNTHNDWRGGR